MLPNTGKHGKLSLYKIFHRNKRSVTVHYSNMLRELDVPIYRPLIGIFFFWGGGVGRWGGEGLFDFD